MTGLTERIEASPDVGSLFLNSLPVDLVRAEDISNAVLFLASDEARVRDRPDHDRRRRGLGPVSTTGHGSAR